MQKCKTLGIKTRNHRLRQSPYVLNNIHPVPHVGQVVMKAAGLRPDNSQARLSSCSFSLFTTEVSRIPFSLTHLPLPLSISQPALTPSLQSLCSVLHATQRSNTIDCWPVCLPESNLSGYVIHSADGTVQHRADRFAQRGGFKNTCS